MSGLIDLERDEKLELLTLLLGWFPIYDFDGFPGEVPELSEYGPSSKDTRITRWMHSVLVDYFKNGNGQALEFTLGYITKHAKSAAKRATLALAQNQNNS